MHSGDKAQNKRSLKRDRVAGEGRRGGLRGGSESRRISHTWNRLVLPNPSKDQEGARQEETRTARGETEKERRRTRAVSLPGCSSLPHFFL